MLKSRFFFVELIVSFLKFRVNKRISNRNHSFPTGIFVYFYRKYIYTAEDKFTFLLPNQLGKNTD